jgi:hypothetical protein
MEIERIYYRLWEKSIQGIRMDKAEFSINAGIPLTFDNLCAINIESNNSLFIEELETIIPKGFGYCNNWLRGLIADYVKRCSRENGNSPYLLEYYIDWLNNTMLILNGKYPFIDEWCKEYREWITNYFKEESTNHEQGIKPPKRTKGSSKFSDIIQYENKEQLLKSLHSLIDGCSKGTDIAAILSKATLDKYLMRLPNEAEVSNEFNLPCSWEAIRKNLIDNGNLKDDKRYIAAQNIVISE